MQIQHPKNQPNRLQFESLIFDRANSVLVLASCARTDLVPLYGCT